MSATRSADTFSRREVLFDSDMITVWYYPAARIVHHMMHRYTSGEVFHDALMAGAQALKAHGASRWLSDDRKNQALPQKHLDWADQVWVPAALKAGWKYWAVVLPDATIGRLNMKRVISMYASRGVEVEVVESPEEGLRWLASRA